MREMLRGALLVLALLSLLACGSKSKSAPAVTTQTIGAEGGLVTLDGIELEIPPGALLAPTEFRVATASEIVSFPFEPTGGLYRILPTSLEFNVAVKLRLPYVENSLIDPSYLRVYAANDLDTGFSATSGGLLSNSSWVEGEITHLGYFSLGVPLSSIDGDTDLESEGADAESEAVDREPDVEAAPSLSSHSPMDFGLVLHGRSTSLDMLLINDGTGPLSISSIALAYDNDPAFTMSAVTNFTIGAKQTAVIPVGFAPSEVRAYYGGCTIFSNDPVNPQRPIKFQGRGAGGGTLALSATDLHFAIPALGIEVTQALTLRNTGGAGTKLWLLGASFADTRSYNLGASPELPLLLAGGQSVDLVVHLNPQVLPAASSSMIVKSDDLANPEQRVTLWAELADGDADGAEHEAEAEREAQTEHEPETPESGR